MTNQQKTKEKTTFFLIEKRKNLKNQIEKLEIKIKEIDAKIEEINGKIK